jgi:hypothetical protein
MESTFEIVTLFDNPMAVLGEFTSERLVLYAKKHGYSATVYRQVLDPERSPSWNKLLAIQKALENPSRWIMWIDADAAIAKFDVKLETILAGVQANFVFGSDFNGLCAGIFFVRNCEWSRQAISAALLLGDINIDPDGFGLKYEQNTFKTLIKYFPRFADQIHILPQRVLNSYPDTYIAGDFILHAHSARFDDRLATLKRLLTQRKLEPQRVSCLMVTKGRCLAKRAVRCFVNQSYLNKELVIVTDAESLVDLTLFDLDIQWVAVCPLNRGQTLGELRNLAISQASGTHVMQWDDDDWYHPDRIKIQMAALDYSGAAVCFLSRWTLAWPSLSMYFISKVRLWEGSMLAKKTALLAYPARRVGEDTELVGQLLQKQITICRLDQPHLYVYIYHGENTYPESHFLNSIFNEYTGILNADEAAELSHRLNRDLL